MNAESLRATIQRLLADDTEFAFQQRLNELQQALGQLSSQPGQQQFQVHASNALEQLKTAVERMGAKYDPAATKRLNELGGARFFGSDMVAEIGALVANNPMTPAVAQQRVATVLAERNSYIQELRNTEAGLKALGIGTYEIEAGTGEIGFQIPRDLFSNELTGLIFELQAIRRIIRAFSELATGSAEPIEVREISTTDPTIYFGLALSTLALIGNAVTWALARWKDVEDIRKARSTTMKIPSFTSDEVANLFDSKISSMIDGKVKEKVEELVPIKSGETGRPFEQRTDIEWALTAILSRVERGMTVEIKFLPPINGDASAQKSAASLAEIVPMLSFPTPDPSPILPLPKMGDRDGA